MNTFQKLRLIAAITKLFLKGDIDMKNWKTTFSGILAAAGQLFPLFGLPTEIGQAVTVIGLFVLGLFSKDNNVTGGTVAQ